MSDIKYTVGVEVDTRKVDALISKLKELDSQANTSSSALKKLESAQKGLKADGVQKTTKELRNLKTAAEDASKASDKIKAPNIEKNLQETVRQAQTLKARFTDLGAASANIKAHGLNQLNSTMTSLGANTQVVHSGLGGLGAMATVGTSLAAGFGAAAISIGKVRLSTSGLTPEMTKTADEVRNLMKEFKDLDRQINKYAKNWDSSKGDFASDPRNRELLIKQQKVWHSASSKAQTLPLKDGQFADIAGEFAGGASGATKLAGALRLVGIGIGAVVGAAVLATGAISSLTFSIAEIGDKFEKMSTRTNIGVERLQVLDQVARMADSSIEELVGASEKLSAKLAKQDEESGKVVKSLKAMNIATLDTNGARKSSLQLMEDIVVAADKAGAGSKEEALAVQALGAEYFKIRGAVLAVTKEKGEMYELMKRTGALMGSEMTAKSALLNDNLDKLKIAFQGLGTTIATAAIDKLSSLIEWMGKVAAGFAETMRKILAPTELENTSKALETNARSINVLEKSLERLNKQAKGNENTEFGKGVLAQIEETKKNLELLKTTRNELNSKALRSTNTDLQKGEDVLVGKKGEGTSTTSAVDTNAQKVQDFLKKINAEIQGLQSIQAAMKTFDSDRIKAAQSRAEALQKLQELELSGDSKEGQAVQAAVMKKAALDNQNSSIQQAINLYESLKKSTAQISHTTNEQAIAYETQSGALKNLSEAMKTKLLQEAKSLDNAKLNEDAKKTIQDLQRSKEELNFTTNAQAMAYELEYGSLKKLDEARKNSLMTAAQELDLARARKKATDDIFAANLQNQDRLKALGNRGLSDRDQYKAQEQQGLKTSEAQEKYGVTDSNVLDEITRKYEALRSMSDSFYKEDEAARQDWLSGLMSGIRTSVDESNDMYSSFKNFGQQMASGWSSNFESMVRGTQSLKDGFKSMIADMLVQLLKMTAYKYILGGLLKLGGAAFGAPTTGVPFEFAAKGMGFDGPRRFAKGGSFTNGIVNEPTNFHMGQMGEAGPEAIVPLTRMSNGNLGVQMQGGGSSQVINIQINVKGGQTNEETGQVISTEVLKAIRGIARDEIMTANRPGQINNPMALR